MIAFVLLLLWLFDQLSDWFWNSGAIFKRRYERLQREDKEFHERHDWTYKKEIALMKKRVENCPPALKQVEQIEETWRKMGLLD